MTIRQALGLVILARPVDRELTANVFLVLPDDRAEAAADPEPRRHLKLALAQLKGVGNRTNWFRFGASALPWTPQISQKQPDRSGRKTHWLAANDAEPNEMGNTARRQSVICRHRG